MKLGKILPIAALVVFLIIVAFIAYGCETPGADNTSSTHEISTDTSLPSKKSNATFGGFQTGPRQWYDFCKRHASDC